MPASESASRAANPGGVKVTEICRSHPDDGEHECLPTEMRCAYCGQRLAPYPCNGCGKFLTAKQMHAASADGENWRCEACD